MRIIKSLIVAFSLYSRIPMPSFKWGEDDMKYAICFIPFVGAVIGAIEFAAMYILDIFEQPVLTKIGVWIAIPLLITGGFHMDGFMDVQDALHSYQSMEKKLEILKDPHIGAFSVISVVIYYCLYMAALASVFAHTGAYTTMAIVCVGFYMVRAMTSLLSLTLPKAKKNGMLAAETAGMGKGAVMAEIILLLAGIIGMIYLDRILAIGTVIVLIVFGFYYKWKCNKEFGGVTGDTAGYLVTVGELLIAIVVAVLSALTL